MANHNQRFMYCDDCSKVVRVDLPECVHFGASKSGGNVGSVTVVYRAKDGTTSVPWNPDDPRVVANAKRKGLERIEYRGVKGERRLAKELDEKDYSRHLRHQEKMERLMAPQVAMRREGL